MMNLYMAWGGTNWGNLAAPVVCERVLVLGPAY